MSEEYYILALQIALIGSTLLIVTIYTTVMLLHILVFTYGKIIHFGGSLYRLAETYSGTIAHTKHTVAKT